MKHKKFIKLPETLDKYQYAYEIKTFSLLKPHRWAELKTQHVKKNNTITAALYIWDHNGEHALEIWLTCLCESLQLSQNPKSHIRKKKSKGKLTHYSNHVKWGRWNIKTRHDLTPNDAIEPQTASRRWVMCVNAHSRVNIWRGVKHQMVHTSSNDLRDQSTWPGKHNTFPTTPSCCKTEGPSWDRPPSALHCNTDDITERLHCAHTDSHEGSIAETPGPSWLPSPPPNAYSSHIKNGLISSPQARDQFGQLSKADRKTFVWAGENERDGRL